MEDTPSQILDNLYLGNYYDAEDYDKLFDRGIKAIVNVTRDIPNYYTEYFTYYNIDIHDQPSVDIYKYFSDVTDFIHSYLSVGDPVLVHCAAGISRSSTIILAYLMKYHQMSLKDAYIYVQSKREIIHPNEGFYNQLIEYDEYWSS